MAETDWVDDPKSNNSDWVDDIPKKSISSPIESGVMHGLQGATGGFLDELAGGVEAAGRVAGIKGGGGSFGDLGLSDEGPTLDWETLRDAYKAARDKKRGVLKKQSEENPMSSGVGELAGMVTSPLNKITKGMSLAKGGAVLGGINGLGNSEAEDLSGMAFDTGVGTALGGTFGKAVDVASPLIQKGASKVGQYLGKGAEKLIENSTGATGKQLENFKPGAGRELLDRGHVRFGDNPNNIAQRTGQAITDAESTISSSLKALDEKGAMVDVEKILENLEEKLVTLKKDPSQADVARKIQSIMQDIQSSGPDLVDTSTAEATKRGFNRMAKNWQDPEKGQAGKIAYRAYRDAVEKSAEAVDPTIANSFKNAKDTFGLLSPIQEAAERRAAVQNQNQFGGLLDLAAGTYGLSDPDSMTGKAALAVAGRRFVAPRVTSSAGVTLDKISKALMKSPQMASLYQKSPQAFQALASKLEQNMSSLPKAAEKQQEEVNKAPDKNRIFEKVKGSKYSQVLQNAAENGDDSFNAAHFVLSQRDPEYRQAIEDGEEQ